MANIKDISNRTQGIDWLVIKNTLVYSDEYNQIKTCFSNGWGISIIAERDRFEIEVNFLEEDFRCYYTYFETKVVLDMIKRVESYER